MTDARYTHCALFLLAGVLAPVALADNPLPADILLPLQASYRTASTCERIQFELRVPAPAPAPGTRASRSSISVQLQPAQPSASADQPAAPSALALELGSLHLFASAGRLTAIHARDPLSFYQTAIEAALSPGTLKAALPPVLVPELDLMSAPADAPVTSFAPYATSVVWQSVETDPRHPTKHTLRGVCAEGEITLLEQNHRLRALTIEVPFRRITLTLTVSTFGPCDPLKAAIDTANRTRVESMDELRPRSGTLKVGVRIPSMPITQGMAGPDKIGGGGNWDMGALLQPPLDAAAAGIKPAEHVVLVFLRTKAPLPLGERRFNPDALAAILKRMHDDAFRARIPGLGDSEKEKDKDKDPAAAIAKFGFAPVLVMNAPEPDEIIRRLKDAGEKWPEVLWSTDPKATIDLFSAGAEAVAVILDAEYVLRAVVPIDQGQTAEQVADQITASLFELGAAETK